MAAIRINEQRVQIPISAEDVMLEGNLALPEQCAGIVVFAHGSGSSRNSPRNRLVARRLNERGQATLLFDLLTHHEDEADRLSGHYRFDVELLARRLSSTTDWVVAQPELKSLPIGYFGASTGAAAALAAAVRQSSRIKAVVSRGGRPDLASASLPAISCATLLIVGEWDYQVIELTRKAFERLSTPQKRLEIVSGATHLFEEPGALERVAQLAGDWFKEYLR
jgi:dienelactone hydrolase